MGISLAPIDIVRQTNTRKLGLEEKSGGMAPLAYRVVEHGVYCAIFVNPNYANKEWLYSR